jgi:hypothetical protein
VLVIDMIEILPPLGKYKYDTWRILLVKCYIDNFVCFQSCIRNVNKRQAQEVAEETSQGLFDALDNVEQQQEESKRECQERVEELTILQARGSVLCQAMVDPLRVRYHLLEGM